MADVKLNSLKFPNLPDRYILDADKVNYSDSETYADGSVGKALQNKANIDGSYDSMTVGNAEQLVSNVRVNDQTPYLFRTSGGSVDIGDREYVNGIVGGTVAWNQLTASDRVTQTISDVAFTNGGNGAITANGTATANAAFYSDANPSVNMIPNHIYYFCGCPSGGTASTYRLGLTQGGSSISLDYGGGNIAKASTSDTGALSTVVFVANGATVNNLKFTPQVFDLTQMFGSTIADYIYSLETANAGAGVAWFRKLFDKPYYAYNAGELKSVSGLVSHDMTGFNQWDEEWELGTFNTTTGADISSTTQIRSKNYIDVIGGQTYFTNANPRIWCLFFDENKSAIPSGAGAGYNVNGNSVQLGFDMNPLAIPSNARYMKFYCQATYGTTYKNDICINISWDGSRNGEYEPYELHSYPLDSDLTLRGIPKLDANNNLYYDGDVYEADGTVTRKYGIVEMNTLTWVTNGVVPGGAQFACTTLNKAVGETNFICDAFVTGVPRQDLGYICGRSATAVISVNTPITDLNQFIPTLQGHYLVYELATPTTETADAYTNPQIVNDFGTEEYVIDSGTFAVPVGHDTDYPVNLVAKLEMAPNSPEGNGDYIVRQTNGTNEYVPLVIEDALPTIPSTAGSYVLTVTVADGSDPTLEWVAQS